MSSRNERLLDLPTLILIAAPLLCAVGWVLVLDLPPMPGRPW